VAPPGCYWSPSRWEIAVVQGRPSALPGPPEDRFVKLPGPVVLALAPALGFLLVMFVPLAGFAIVGAHAGSALVRALRRRPSAQRG
jgi:hypothetical protein